MCEIFKNNQRLFHYSFPNSSAWVQCTSALHFGRKLWNGLYLQYKKFGTPFVRNINWFQYFLLYIERKSIFWTFIYSYYYLLVLEVWGVYPRILVVVRQTVPEVIFNKLRSQNSCCRQANSPLSQTQFSASNGQSINQSSCLNSNSLC